MSANSGNGTQIDVTFKAALNLRTTTAQYMVVGIVPGSTGADYTVEGCFNSATNGGATSTSRFAIGVNQSYMSANSTECTVRLLGISKVKCGDSITAGEWLMAAVGTPTSTLYGTVMAVNDQVTSSAATMSTTAHQTILGRSLEDGSTSTVIGAFINPQMYDANLVASTTA